MTVLIIRGGAIGDFVVTLPVFAAIRQRWRETRIACLGYPRMTTLALAAGLIDEALSLDSADAARLFAAGARSPAEWTDRLQRYDVILSYLHDPDDVVKDNLLACGARRVITHSPLVMAGHAADHFLAPVAELEMGPMPCGRAGGNPDPGSLTSLPLPRPLLAKGASELRRLAGEKVMFLHPGSGSAKKNWPLEKFLELAGRLRGENGLSPAFLLGEAEAEMGGILRQASHHFAVIREPDLVTLAALLAAGRGYVGNDAGITHLAAAVGVPVVAIFGPTDPETWAPRGPGVRVIRAAAQDTRALHEVTVGAVLDAVRPY